MRKKKQRQKGMLARHSLRSAVLFLSVSETKAKEYAKDAWLVLVDCGVTVACRSSPYYPNVARERCHSNRSHERQ